jgi:hypothetical protein
MQRRPAQPPPAKADRNTHEVSSDESRPAESHQETTRGGGHRSGSRGAGTLENGDGRPQPRQGPRGAARAGQWR